MTMHAFLRTLRDRHVALGLSLALNVLLVAYVATQLLQSPPPRRPAGVQAMIERIARDLPAGDKDVFERAFAQDRGRLTAASDAMREARRGLDASIAARPFDPAATRAAMQQWREAWQRMSTTFEDSFLAALQGISPDGRAQIVAHTQRATSAQGPQQGQQ
jgi:uncharacterized membrane protein